MFSLDKKNVFWAVGGLVVGFLAVGAVWGSVEAQRNEYARGVGGQAYSGEQISSRSGERSTGGNQNGARGNNQERRQGQQGQTGSMNGSGQGKNTGQQGNQNGAGQGRCFGDECLAMSEVEAPTEPLSESVKNALNIALADEYKARATYASVIRQFGDIRPFSRIIQAEEQHIKALLAIYDRYGVVVPVDTTSNIPSFESLEDACSAGVEAEVENASLYRDTLLPKVAQYEDVVFVFTNLMNASQDKHLPAFQQCQ